MISIEEVYCLIKEIVIDKLFFT